MTARWVKDVYHTTDPQTSSYDVVVSSESILIALMDAAFQVVNVLAADFRNAYLQSSFVG